MTKRIVVKGAVQGIGYRPFISEKATEYGLSGYVKNCGASVEILVSGKDGSVDSFVALLSKEVPAGGFVLSVEVEEVDGSDVLQPVDGKFEIIESSELDLSSELPVFLPDIGICDDCMEEMLDPSNRRYRYPLISCAVCGPRMSILNRLPYDRNTTTMEDFEMCPSCSSDYGIGRRKYAQTISCHDCGPQMILRVGNENAGKGEEAIQEAIQIIRDGGIIGLKGISGYQLVCRPEAEVAGRLRRVKGRENKPFAIMFSTPEQVKEYAEVSGKEAELLTSSARPIVLVKQKNFRPSESSADRKTSPGFCDEVLKGSRYIGAFLPSAGIHRLLTDELGPLIVTSANKSDQPMIIDDEKFVSAFMTDNDDKASKENSYANTETVDAVLFHERRINMAQDDSVMFVVDIDGVETEQFIRRARGFAPLPILLDTKTDSSSVLAVGGDLKSIFCLGKKDRLLPSQYIGDLEDYETYKSYGKLLKDYRRIFEFDPDVIIHDLHPNYMSTRFAKETEETDTKLGLQHHFAHTYSVMAENSLHTAIGVSFDGTGYGLDGKIWGGEFVCCDGSAPERIGHLSYIKLAGGDEAPKKAKSVAFCYMIECERKGLIDILDTENQKLYEFLKGAVNNNINTFETSSMGRLFDAVAALLGICEYNSYEGEAAIMLEKAAMEFYDRVENAETSDYPRFEFSYYAEDGNMNIPKALDGKESFEGCFVADQTALFADIYKCYMEGSYPVGAIAYGFHRAIADLIVKGCKLAEKQLDRTPGICLSGGVFNNRLLLINAVKALKQEGFEVYWNSKVPLGDGGISTGQAYYGMLINRSINGGI